MSAQDWARRYGFRESAIVHRIQAGVLDGVEVDGTWYVVRNVQRTATANEWGEVDIFDLAPATEVPTREPSKYSRWASAWLAPRYDELTLFIMSVSAIAIVALDSGFRSDLTKFVFYSGDARITYILFPCFVAGLIISLVHGLTRRQKTEFDRELMLWFAIVMQGGVGLAASVYFLSGGDTVGVLFGFWNLLLGVGLFSLYRMNLVTTENIVEGETSRPQIVIAFIGVLVGAVVTLHVFELHWVAGLSISVALASTLSEAIDLGVDRFGKKQA